MVICQVNKYLSILVLFFSLTVGCNEAPKKDKNLDGKSLEFVKQRYGQPTSEKEFILSKSLYEYQYGLLVYYPHPNGKNIHIIECVWDTKGRNTVVWFHKIKGRWVSLDNITGNPDKVTF